MSYKIWTLHLLLTITLLTNTLKNDDNTQQPAPQQMQNNQEEKKNHSDPPSGAEQREIEDAIEFGLKAMRELVEVKEPEWYRMGLYLADNHPAKSVANFGAPSKKALELSRWGYAALEATRKIAESHPAASRQQSAFLDQRLPQQECPLHGLPRCNSASKRYRTADGTCNNLSKPWRGSSLLPFRRFLQPVYEDGVQEPRRAVSGFKLPSARLVSSEIHRDRDIEISAISLMFMQWGQFIDHDLTSTVKSRGFNGTIPRCCLNGGEDVLPPDLTHPNCFPIEVLPSDWFLARFNLRCVEFLRSAPSTRINCDLGYREQLNQVTSYLDGSTIYGSDVATSDSMRTFRHGKLQYGRPKGREPLLPPDPPGGELCRAGALTSDCLQSGDGRLSEQPALTALHTVWLRYHNLLADILSQLNRHWSDEKVYQETRRIVVAMVQHITYREFLPIVLGQEVIELFELDLQRKGYYTGYDKRVRPEVANSFSTAAFRFGHSLVQNSYMRYDGQHRPIFNNVTLHEEQQNIQNIWSFGSVDRLILGLVNQPSQRRDEFVADELTNHLFQPPGVPFGMDLAAINIQRGRDHGLPAYTAWRQPCGLSRISSWGDLAKIMHPETVARLQRVYRHPDDIDLFTGGLAEKPVRGGVIGPTFACIIAQQFLNLRKGDRFWYENGGTEASFTPAQLQQLRHVTFAHVLCQTLKEIETIQPFVFLVADRGQNERVNCRHALLNNFDLTAWIEHEEFNEIDSRLVFSREDKKARKKKRKLSTTTTTTKRPKTTRLQIQITNVTTNSVKLQNKQTYNNQNNNFDVYDIPQRPTFDSYYGNKRRPTTDRNDVTYLFGMVEPTTPPPPQKPIEVNIKIQYYPPTPAPTTKKPAKQKRPVTRRPAQTTTTMRRPVTYYDPIYSDDFSIYKPTRYQDEPFATSSKRPYIYQPSQYLNDIYQNKRRPEPSFEDVYALYYRPNNDYNQNGYVQKFTTDQIHDKLDFQAGNRKQFVKISSVSGQQQYLDSAPASIHLHIAQREGEDLTIEDNNDDVRLVDLHVMPNNEKRWLIYNATETSDDIQQTVLPTLDFNKNVSCTDELPRPINVTTVQN